MTVELNHTVLTNKDEPMQKVKDWMASSPVVRLGEELKQAVEMMMYQKCREVVVVDANNRVLGLLTSSTLFSVLLNSKSLNASIEETMLDDVQPVYAEDPVSAIPSFSFQTIPVINNRNKLVGVMTSAAVIHFLSELVNSKSQDAEALDVILESAYEGVVLADEKGIIRKMNDAYQNFLGVKGDDVIGKHVTEVIENTRMHIALETGIPERGFIQQIQGQNMVVHRIPIWRSNEIVGAIGMLIFEGVTELYNILERANETNRLRGKKALPSKKQEKKQKVTFESIIGESHELTACKSVARRASRTMATVLITGASGTGKEMFARAIHHMSPCADGPFVSLNCAAIPEHLLEAELFGYEDGAFTGARRGGKPGKFEVAHNGTLFLDEIGDMPLPMQAKILRVLQEKEVERVGGDRKKPIQVRIIAATNHWLEHMVSEGTFREDLYYRLNIIRLSIPALKERKDDIPLLMSHHLKRFCEAYGFKPKTFTREAIKALMKYDWPGNAREVVNTAERLVALVEEETIQFRDLPETMTEEAGISFCGKEAAVLPLKEERLEQEKSVILSVLQEVNGNKTKAAELLGIHRSTLYQKLKRLQIY